MTSKQAKVRMAELTGAEGREIFAGNPVILLPMGSYEDHGPHAPMGDYMSAEAVAVAIARRATAAGESTYVAPVVPFGGTDFFSSVPGGIALEEATLRSVFIDIVGCLLRHNLTRLIVLNGHGGNVDVIHQTTVDIFRTKGILIPSLYLWRITNAFLPEILGGEKAARSTGHGADPVTSIAMHLFPDCMRNDLLREPAPPPDFIGLPVSGFATVRFQGADVQVPLQADRIAPAGVWKAVDPRLCSPETGAALVERLAGFGADFILHLAAQDATAAS